MAKTIHMRFNSSDYVTAFSPHQQSSVSAQYVKWANLNYLHQDEEDCDTVSKSKHDYWNIQLP